jgi:hypothetical protein
MTICARKRPENMDPDNPDTRAQVERRIWLFFYYLSFSFSSHARVMNVRVVSFQWLMNGKRRIVVSGLSGKRAAVGRKTSKPAHKWRGGRAAGRWSDASEGAAGGYTPGRRKRAPRAPLAQRGWSGDAGDEGVTPEAQGRSLYERYGLSGTNAPYRSA